MLSQEESLRFTAAAVEEAGRRVVHEPVEGVLALGGLVHVREDPLLEHLAVLDGVRPRIELVGATEHRRHRGVGCPTRSAHLGPTQT